MPRAASHFRQSDVERAVKAACNAGLEVGGVEITKDGTIRVMVGRESLASGEANEWDEVLE